MWQVNIIKNENYNCFQNLIASISDFYQTDYQMLMFELLGFEYRKDVTGNIGNRLGLSWFNNLEYRATLLKDFHYFTFRSHTMDKYSQKDFLELLSTSPIAIYVDSYDCSWLPYYHKMHRSHICLAIGIMNDQLICVDEYTENPIQVPSQLFFCDVNVTHYLTFMTTTKHVIERQSYMTALNTCLTSYRERNTICQIKDFVSDMCDNFAIENEIEQGSDPISSQLVMLLKNLSDDRYNFIEALAYIEQKTKISFCSEIQLLQELSQSYLRFRAYLLKCAFKSSIPNHELLVKNLNQIYNAEITIYSDLLKTYNNASEYSGRG